LYRSEHRVDNIIDKDEIAHDPAIFNAAARASRINYNSGFG